MPMPVKQVIVMRKDLKMRRGKEIAQGAHASVAWLALRVQGGAAPELSEDERAWIDGSFAKVCLQIEGEEALRDVHARALAAGLESHLIVDSGRTEFHGVPTPTCLGIGPAEAARIDAVTGDLKLY
jgi:peptidyl-tRNA hydrolase, PTH2 family